MFQMSDKTFNTLSKIQKALLVIMAIASIVMGVSLVITARSLTVFEDAIDSCILALLCLDFALAMIFGFIYANKGYSKQAHGYYKAMMCFYAFTAAIQFIASFRESSFSLVALIAIIKFVLLLILGFGKDLGKKNTWIIFYIVFVLELLFAPVLQFVDPSMTIALPAALSRLVIAGVLGLCIEAKYRDKDARGTV